MVVRIGVVGAGYWSEECHVPGLKLADEAEVVALSGRRVENTKSQAARLSIPKAYTDYRTMLEEEELDAITITTPNSTHREIALAALEKGLSVFCEKPLALNAEEAAEMAAAAGKLGLVNHVGFTFRFLQSSIKAKELLAEGFLGHLFHARLWAENDSGLIVRPLAWRDDKTLAGTGQLGDMGSHIFDLFRYVTGDEFTAVYAHSRAVQPKREAGSTEALATVDDFNSLMFETERGVSGIAVASRVTRGLGGWSVEFFGTKGAMRIVYSRGWKDELWYAPHGEEYRLMATESIMGDFAMLHMMEAFVAEIAGRKPLTNGIPATFNDGLRAQEVIDAVLLSAVKDAKVAVRTV